LKIHKEILLQIPFVDLAPADGRVVYDAPCFDRGDNTYKLYFQRDDALGFVYARPAEACYWAESIADETRDLFVPLLHTISNHYSFPSIQETLLRIQYDILNLSVVVEKYFVFLDLFRRKREPLISGMIRTDLEYYFGVSMSLFDLVHDVLRDLWRMKHRPVVLPDTFRKMAGKEPEELGRKYNLPNPLISYYATTKDFFLNCREIRDCIYHGGLTPDFIVCFDDGFGFQKDSQFFPSRLVSELDLWPREKIRENNLVSILPLVSFINKRILENLAVFSQALIQSIEPLDPISNRYKLFLRGPYTHHLTKCDEYIDRQWIPSN